MISETILSAVAIAMLFAIVLFLKYRCWAMRCPHPMLNQRHDNRGKKTMTNSFKWNGYLITDPTMDETGRFEVDPNEYWKPTISQSAFVELYSTIGGAWLEDAYLDPIWDESDPENITYTEEAQDRFNEITDKLDPILRQFLKVEGDNA